MIKTVIFDIDGTLYDISDADKKGIDALRDYAESELGIDRDTFDDVYATAHTALCAGTRMNCATNHNRLIRYQLMLEELGRPIEAAPDMARVYWTTLLDTAKPFPGARECILALKDAGCRIGIGTDMTADLQFAKLKVLGLLPFIDFMVTSEETVLEKPDPWFFETCIKKAGCTPEECVYVGDRPPKDIKGAVDCGMNAIWYCGNAQFPLTKKDHDLLRDYPVMAVESLGDIPGLIL